MGLTRRDVLMAGCSGSAVFACAFLAPSQACAADQSMDLVEQLVGGTVAASDRVHLEMPAEFPTGYTVPMDLRVDSPMTEADHVRGVRVFAPQNPIIEVARFISCRSAASPAFRPASAWPGRNMSWRLPR